MEPINQRPFESVMAFHIMSDQVRGTQFSEFSELLRLSTASKYLRARNPLSGTGRMLGFFPEAGFREKVTHRAFYTRFKASVRGGYEQQVQEQRLSLYKSSEF